MFGPYEFCIKTYLLLTLAQCLPLTGNQLGRLNRRNALEFATGVSGLDKEVIGMWRSLHVSRVVKFAGVGRAAVGFARAGKPPPQLSTSIVGNPDLLRRVGLEPLFKLGLSGSRLLFGETVVMLVW